MKRRLRRKRVQARKMAVEVKCWATGVCGVERRWELHRSRKEIKGGKG